MTDLLDAPSLSTRLSDAFEAGQTLDAFRTALADDNPGRIDLEKPVTLAGADLAFREIVGLRVLAIVEDWCKDSRDALPVLDALLRASPESELRVVRRDEHPDVMAAYLKDGVFAAIPVFVFMDRDFNELARYIERPASVTRLRRAEREALARRDPRFAPAEAKPATFDEPVKSELKAAILELRAESQPQASVLIAAELAAMVDRIVAAKSGRLAASPAPAAPAGAATPVQATSATLLAALAQRGPLQIIDFGDDDCEIEPAS